MATGRISTGCIVVGVDAARATDRAVDWAADQAALEGRHLHLVHGTEPRLTLGSAAAVTLPTDAWGPTDEPETTGHAILGRATTRAVSRHPELVVHQTLRAAEPGRLLVDLSVDAALVVVGSRGRGHVLRLALGSVSEDVAERAACPVVVLRPRHDDAPQQEVLVAVADTAGSDDAAGLVRFALRHAAVRRQSLTLLLTRSGEAATLPTVVEPAEGPRLALERRALVDALAAAAEPGVVVPTTLLVGSGAPAECILSLAGDMALVVIGHHPRQGPGRLGHASVAVDVLDNAPATIAVVPLDENSCCK
jgi:nucleotide-binding universal stress UspA family protein